MNKGAKVSSKTLANQIQQHIKNSQVMPKYHLSSRCKGGLTYVHKCGEHTESATTDRRCKTTQTTCQESSDTAHAAYARKQKKKKGIGVTYIKMIMTMCKNPQSCSEWVELQSFLPESGKTLALYTHSSCSVPDWKPQEGLLNNKNQKDPNRKEVIHVCKHDDTGKPK